MVVRLQAYQPHALDHMITQSLDVLHLSVWRPTLLLIIWPIKYLMYSATPPESENQTLLISNKMRLLWSRDLWYFLTSMRYVLTLDRRSFPNFVYHIWQSSDHPSDVPSSFDSHYKTVETPSQNCLSSTNLSILCAALAVNLCGRIKSGKCEEEK